MYMWMVNIRIILDITGKVRIWGLNEDFSLLYEGQQLSGVIRDIRFSGDTEYLTVVGEGLLVEISTFSFPLIL